MSTVLEILDGGTRYLEQRGVEDARRNMQLLLAKELGCSRMGLYTQFDRPLEEAVLAPMREHLKKRGQGVPLQHLLGEVVFHGRTFRCDARALIPRPETEELAELILKLETRTAIDVLDIGCGSGVLGLTLAGERPEWRVRLSDLCGEALALARENAAAVGLEGCEFAEGDLIEPWAGAAVDGIVANLPYIPEGERAELSREVCHDPAQALFSGADGLDAIRRCIPAALAALRPGGWLALEVGYNQGDVAADLMRTAGFSRIDVHSDLTGIPRFPWGWRD
ncbi:MAG: peptide chain release factor N(5)-glutamine methyltransferase [Luteolibacter sp.]